MLDIARSWRGVRQPLHGLDLRRLKAWRPQHARGIHEPMSDALSDEEVDKIDYHIPTEKYDRATLEKMLKTL
jgi:hypothetical protein